MASRAGPGELNPPYKGGGAIKRMDKNLRTPQLQPPQGLARVLGPFDSYPNYPWLPHALMLLPLIAAMCVVGGCHGFWGEGVRLFYEQCRELYPGITDVMQLFSDYAVELIYVIYLVIVVRAFWLHNRPASIFVLRYVVGVLLFAMLATQLIKIGLGFPRPGFGWPPQPFNGSDEFSSFPSGHTVNIVLASIPLAMWLRSRISCVILAGLILVVGYSRIWLGQHHPVDVLGGVVLGSLWARFVAASPAYLASLLNNRKTAGKNVSKNKY